MRKLIGALTAAALAATAALLAAGPEPARAQAGGTLEVQVTYGGAPQVDTIKVNKDTKQCGTEATIARVAVGANKGLANAVVSVPGTTGGAKPAGKAEIDQKGCAFRPHVVAMMPGEIDVKNSDGILHNIHTYSTANPTINKAQPKFKKVLREKFTKPEVIKVTCDVHSWMEGYVVVVPTPFFGVTDQGGAVKIEGVPAGKHTVEVWHEVLGKQTAEVEVKAGQTTKVSLEMKKG